MQSLAAGKIDLVSQQIDVLHEIRLLLAPYVTCGVPIGGDTVISDGTTIDSLTIMDMVMELEDRFGVAIPTNVEAEIRTVNQLADTFVRLARA